MDALGVARIGRGCDARVDVGASEMRLEGRVGEVMIGRGIARGDDIGA